LEAAYQQFDKFPADLGLLDHGYNMKERLDHLQDLAKTAIPAITKIVETLVSKASSLPVNVERKRDAVRDIANSLRDEVMTLERVADEIGPTTQEWIEAYRNVFAEPDAKHVNPQDLEGVAETYEGGVALTFRQLTKAYKEMNPRLKRFHGKQQALNRIVMRSTAAIRRIAGATGQLSDFCSAELPRLVRSVRPPDVSSRDPV
jgi:hypothetical protein